MLEDELKRISIVGGPGTGKTTLAKNLGKMLNLPVYHLDGIDHLENWKKRDREERDRIILEKVSEDKWVIDGTYKGTLEKRIDKSNLIIFLDYSTISKLKGILTRYNKLKGQEREEMPGYKEKMDLHFIMFTLTWNKKSRKKVQELLEKYKNKKIIIFKNRKKLNSWYEKEFDEKIKL